MGLDLSSSKAVLLPVALSATLFGGLFLAGSAPAKNEPTNAPTPGEQTTQANPRTIDRAANAATRTTSSTKLTNGAAVQTKATLAHVLHASWGNALAQLGHDLPVEAAPLGPTSFVVTAEGFVHVLDAVNSRIVVYERDRAVRTIPLAQDTFQDLDFHGDGYVLLDPFTASSLAFTDDQGRIRHEVPLVGEGVPEPGLVTGIFDRADGVWVEVGHDYLVRLTDEHGAPVEKRTRAEGRFIGDGPAATTTTIEAMAAKPWGARVVRHERGAEVGKALVQTTFSLPLLSITGVEGTADGGVFLGVRLHEDEVVSPFAIKRTEHWIIAFDANGDERDRLLVPEQTGPEEMFREMKAGRDGKMYAWTFTETGVDLYRREP
jgi:hypothetical protein